MYRQLLIIVNQVANQINKTSHIYNNAGHVCMYPPNVTIAFCSQKYT